MNVFILTKEPFPNGMAATNRIKCLAKAFLSAGVNCKVVIFRKNKLNDQYKSVGFYDGVPYEYITDSLRQRGDRFFGYISFLILQMKLLLYLRKTLNKGDFVYGFLGTENLLRKCIIKIVHKRGGYYISELCEYPFGTGKESTIVDLQRKYALKKLFPLFDGVVAISNALFLLAQKYCSQKCEIINVPILVDYDKYDLPDNSINVSQPFIFHSGTLTEQKDGILGAIEAFGIAVNRIEKKIHFIIAGKKESSPHLNEINELLNKYNIRSRVHFIGYLPYEKLKKPLSEASLVVLNKYPTQQNHYGFSTKLGEYLAAGKPVIITRVGEAINWLSDGINAIIIEPNNSNLLANAIVDAFSNVDKCRRMGQQAKLLCKKSFDYNNYGIVLLGLLNNILDKSKV